MILSDDVLYCWRGMRAELPTPSSFPADCSHGDTSFWPSRPAAFNFAAVSISCAMFWTLSKICVIVMLLVTILSTFLFSYSISIMGSLFTLRCSGKNNIKNQSSVLKKKTLKNGTYITLCSTLQSGFDAWAGALVTLARNSLAERASPVHGENWTRILDICFSCMMLVRCFHDAPLTQLRATK